MRWRERADGAATMMPRHAYLPATPIQWCSPAVLLQRAVHAQPETTATITVASAVGVGCLD